LCERGADVVDVGYLDERPLAIFREVIGSGKPVLRGVHALQIFVTKAVVREARNLDDELHLATIGHFDAGDEVGQIGTLYVSVKIEYAEAEEVVFDVATHLGHLFERLGGNLFPAFGVRHDVVDVALHGGEHGLCCCAKDVNRAAFRIVVTERSRDLVRL